MPDFDIYSFEAWIESKIIESRDEKEIEIYKKILNYTSNYNKYNPYYEQFRRFK